MTETNVKGLRPCPFCGGTPTIVGPANNRERYSQWSVSCSCGGRSGMSDSLSQAIEYWNRRPIEDEINWQNNNAHEVIKNLHDEIDGLNYQIKAIEDAGCLWKEGFYDEVDTWEKNRRSQEASDLDIRIQDDQP